MPLWFYLSSQLSLRLHGQRSQRLLFDKHNHPVSKKQEQEMTKAERSRCRWRRHYKYKAVLLLHCDAAGERARRLMQDAAGGPAKGAADAPACAAAAPAAGEAPPPPTAYV